MNPITLLIILLLLTLLLLSFCAFFMFIRNQTYENLTNNEWGLGPKIVLRASKKKMKSRDIATRIYNKYVYGSTLEHHVLPNSDIADNVLPEINDVYTDILADIRTNPTVINSDIPVDINAVIDHAEEFTNIDAEPVREAIREARYRDEYYDQTNIRNDPQNVHESEVVNEFTSRYKEIKRVNGPHTPISELRDAMRENEKAMKAINIMSPIMGGKSARVTALADDEAAILQHVWTRVNSPENEQNRESLMRILEFNLASIYEKKSPVCITGRFSRLLDIFTLIDANPLIAAPIKTAQILRNEIFAYTQLFVQNQMETNLRFRDYMNGVSEDNSMIGAIHDELERNIRSQYPHVKQSVLNNIINDAKAGIE